MTTYFSREVVDKVQKLLTTPASAKPINTTWENIMAIFRAEKIIKPKRVIHPSEIFPQPKNMGWDTVEWIQRPSRFEQGPARWR